MMLLLSQTTIATRSRSYMLGAPMLIRIVLVLESAFFIRVWNWLFKRSYYAAKDDNLVSSTTR